MAEYTILWYIENYSYCWHNNGRALFSPEFTVDGLEGRIWALQLYPRGFESSDKGYISLFLKRIKCDTDLKPSKLKYELSILKANGSTEHSHSYEYTFLKNVGYGHGNFIPMDKVLLLEKDAYLPQDTLCLRCKLRREDWNVQRIKEIVARTRIAIEQVSFLHVTELFSDLEPHKKNTIQIGYPSSKLSALSSSLYFNDDLSDGKLMMEITPPAQNYGLSKCEVSLLDASGKLFECGKIDVRTDGPVEKVRSLPLSLTRQAILNGKCKYLPDDKLTLSCECIFSTGVEYEKIEKILSGKPFVGLDPNDIQETNIYNSTEKLAACPSALDDLKAMYTNQLLTDFELKTKTKSFPAHKIWLSARSSVFKTMLTNDMKERNCNSIHVDDLEDNTVEQLLLFLYTDNIGNLQWESAMKLYYASDYYEIEKLKVICSSFLIDSVTPSTAGELLLLADRHSDSDLRKAVEAFILKHDDQVFGSEEWKKLAEINLQLGFETMLLKYK